jgi:hypothetical protein
VNQRLAAVIIMSAPGAACYFCLGEEADEEGEAAGPGLLLSWRLGWLCPSILLYHVRHTKYGAFIEPWENCTNCKQPFQGQLSIVESSACVSFAEATHGHVGNSKWDKLKVLLRSN